MPWVWSWCNHNARDPSNTTPRVFQVQLLSYSIYGKEMYNWFKQCNIGNNILLGKGIVQNNHNPSQILHAQSNIENTHHMKEISVVAITTLWLSIKREPQITLQISYPNHKQSNWQCLNNFDGLVQCFQRTNVHCLDYACLDIQSHGTPQWHH